jgi:Ca-activated chloride channel homolog
VSGFVFVLVLGVLPLRLAFSQGSPAGAQAAPSAQGSSTITVTSTAKANGQAGTSSARGNTDNNAQSTGQIRNPAELGPSTNPPPPSPWPINEPAAQPAQTSGAPTSAGAQGSKPSQGGGPTQTNNGIYVFQAEAREVMLHATVVDERNHLVTNLTKDDFTVFENDQQQQIRQFAREDYPVAMGILVDNSGSMREKRDEVNKAALNLVKSSNSGDQVFVVNFSDEPILDQEFTSDIRKLQAALEHVEARGGTALYDAIVAASDYLGKSRLTRKVLFVVTDGEDDASQESLEEAVQRVQQENGPTIYSIGLLGDEKNRKAKRALETLSQRTGGIAFFPPTLDQVDEISRSVAHDIRSQYTISYTPTTPKSVGGFRTIHVDAHARPYKHLSVRTRTGYYPGQESSMK